jgi:hypothetical protein
VKRLHGTTSAVVAFRERAPLAKGALFLIQFSSVQATSQIKNG